jgi:hypothetical protein
MITGPEFAHAVEALLLEHGAIVHYINGNTPILVIHLTDDREVIGFGFGKIFEICLRDHGYNPRLPAGSHAGRYARRRRRAHRAGRALREGERCAN